MTPSALETTLYALIFSLVAGTPLCMALLCCTPLKIRVVQLLPLAVVPALFVAFTAPTALIVNVEWFFMGGCMGLDETGRIFLFLAGFVWLLASFSSRTLLKRDNNQIRYYLFFLTAMAGNFGLILAQGMLGYYLFYAMMSFAVYGLVVHRGDEEAQRAGRIYLLLLMIGEVALFTVLLILVHSSGGQALGDIVNISYHPLIPALLFVGFGVKIGALPLHGWMMPAYQNTPIPAATALAGSMVNAGILGWLRFMPLGQVHCPDGAVLFMAAGALAAVYGVVAGLGRKQPGAVLGASSISQMGLITVIFGMGLLDQDAGRHAAPVLILYVVHHSLAKSSLFLGYDLVQRQKRRMSNLQIAAILLPALALAGLPFSSGAIAKTAFKELAHHLGEPWTGLSVFFLPLTAMATSILILHFVTVLRRSRGRDAPGSREIRVLFALSWVAVALTLWLWPAASSVASHSVSTIQLLQGLWPVAGGTLLFLVWRKFFCTTKDLQDDQKRTSLFDRIGSGVAHCLQEKDAQQVQEERFLIFLRKFVPHLRRIEKIMGRWKVAGLSYIALCLGLLFVLLV